MHQRLSAGLVFLLAAGCAAAGGPAPLSEDEVLASPIVGGEPTTSDQFPFYASLLIRRPVGGASLCGGSVLPGGWILTAAHCLAEGWTRVDVFVANHSFDHVVNGTPDATAEEVLVHAQFCEIVAGERDWSADVALLRLDRDVSTLPGVATTRLASLSDTAARSPGAPATVIGLGQDGAGSYPSQLQRVDVELLSPSVRLPLADMLRAGGAGVGACMGDSGGPLVHDTGAGWLQIGLSSRGPYVHPDGTPEAARCGEHSYHTDLARLAGWIEGAMARGAGAVPACVPLLPPAVPEPTPPEPAEPPPTEPPPSEPPPSAPSPLEGVGDSCSADTRTGTCVDTATTSCGGETRGGLCRGLSQVRCCLPKLGVGTSCQSGGSTGTCIDTGTTHCSGAVRSGLCTGPSEVRCCLP